MIIIWYLSFSDLLHWLWFLGPLILLQLALFRYFFWLSNLPLYTGTTSSLSIPLSMGTYVAPMSWPLWIVLLWTWIACVFSNYSLPWTGTGLLGHTATFFSLRKSHTVHHNGCSNIHPHQQYSRVPFAPHSLLAFIVCRHFWWWPLWPCEVIPHGSFDLHFWVLTIALISHASKVMLKILQARLQQYVNRELPDVQPGFRKGRGSRDQLPTSAGSSKKQESSRKTSISALLTTPKPLTLWVTINCGKFWKRWEYQPT